MRATSFKVGEDVLVQYGIFSLLHKANIEKVRKHHVKLSFYNPIHTEKGEVWSDWIRKHHLLQINKETLKRKKELLERHKKSLKSSNKVSETNLKFERIEERPIGISIGMNNLYVCAINEDGTIEMIEGIHQGDMLYWVRDFFNPYAKGNAFKPKIQIKQPLKQHQIERKRLRHKRVNNTKKSSKNLHESSDKVRIRQKEQYNLKKNTPQKSPMKNLDYIKSLQENQKAFLKRLRSNPNDFEDACLDKIKAVRPLLHHEYTANLPTYQEIDFAEVNAPISSLLNLNASEGKNDDDVLPYKIITVTFADFVNDIRQKISIILGKQVKRMVVALPIEIMASTKDAAKKKKNTKQYLIDHTLSRSILPIDIIKKNQPLRKKETFQRPPMSKSSITNVQKKKMDSDLAEIMFSQNMSSFDKESDILPRSKTQKHRRPHRELPLGKKGLFFSVNTIAFKLPFVENVSFIHHGTAAGICHRVQHRSFEINPEHAYFLLFHCGSCSMSCSIILYNDKNSGKFDIIQSHKVFIGGTDFTQRLVSHCMNEFKKIRPSAVFNESHFKRLASHCERIKIQLTKYEETTLQVYEFYDREPFTLVIHRETFESLCQDLFQRAVPMIKDCLTTLTTDKSSKDVLEYIFYSGGSMNIPALQKVIVETCPFVSIFSSTHNEHMLAKGAAIQCDYLSSIDEVKPSMDKAIHRSLDKQYIGTPISSTTPVKVVSSYSKKNEHYSSSTIIPKRETQTTPRYSLPTKSSHIRVKKPVPPKAPLRVNIPTRTKQSPTPYHDIHEQIKRIYE
mmetsp:Transcript_7740/g.11492  ORF Transcript_7740/g.11492 Transcript_7740/m.11492 type:complete len:790 (-) Transcript_7740:15-2384(-)